MSSYFKVEVEVLGVSGNAFAEIHDAMKTLQQGFDGALAWQFCDRKRKLRDFLLQFDWSQWGSEDDVLTEISQQVAQQLPPGTTFKVGALCTDSLPWERSDFKVTKNRKARLR